MHEYGLAEGVLATVRQRAAGRKVAGIRVRFGVKHAVDEESMAQAWGFVAEGTEAEGSRWRSSPCRPRSPARTAG